MKKNILSGIFALIIAFIPLFIFRGFTDQYHSGAVTVAWVIGGAVLFPFVKWAYTKFEK